MANFEPTVAGMDNTGRSSVVITWIQCESCGRIDKAAQEFNYRADIPMQTVFSAWIPCERCGQQAKLHLRRELKPGH